MASESDFKDGVELVMQQGAMLALFPIERWLQELEHQDSIAPILDPTAYRKYLWSGRGDMLKEILRAAAQFKAAIVKAQNDVLAGNVR